MTKVDLVLSGGAVKAIAHLALIKRLEKMSVQISTISGVSAGGIIAACYASDMSERDIIQFFKDAPLFKFSYLSPSKPGLFDSDKYRAFLSDCIPNDFSALSVPIYLAVANLSKSKIEYFNEGDLIEAVTCTCALPPIFSPITVNNDLYVDGGVIDNFPVLPLSGSKQKLIGSYVCTPGQKDTMDLSTMLKVSNHSTALLVHAANKHKFDQVDFLVNFPLQKFGSFKTTEVDDIYKAAQLHLNSIQESLETSLTKIEADI